MNARERKRYEKKLLEMRADLVKQLDAHRAVLTRDTPRDSSGDLSAYSYHMADLGSDAIEREKEFLTASAEGRRLQEINEALRRVHTKEFGACETCRRLIARDRLDVMPYARLCIRCQEEEERQGGGS